MKRQILWIAVVLAVVAVSSSAVAGDHEFVGADKCKMCHKVQYTSWVEMGHAKAFDQLAEGDKANAECLKCHATGGRGGVAALESFSPTEGVGCESCHGPGSEYSPEPIMRDR